MSEISSQSERADTREYVCKLKTKKSNIDYTKYRFYNKSKPFRFVKFLHRGVSNIFLRAYLKCFHHVKVIGKENVEALKKTGAVIVSNHIHPLDIQMIATFVFGMRSVHWLTLQRNMDLSVRAFIRNSGGVPIPEDYEQKKALFCRNERSVARRRFAPYLSRGQSCGIVRRYPPV